MYAEEVYLEPPGIVGGRSAVVLAVARLDAYGEVVALGHVYHHFHVLEHELVVGTAGISCVGVVLTGREQVGIVALRTVVLHVVVGEEAAARLLGHLHPQLARHEIASGSDVVVADGLVERELLRHGHGVYPAHVVAVIVGRALVHAV